MARTKNDTKSAAEKKADNKQALKEDAARKAAGSSEGGEPGNGPGEGQGENGTDETDPAKVPATDPGHAETESVEDAAKRVKSEDEKAKDQARNFDSQTGLEKLTTRSDGQGFTKHQALGSKSEQVI